MPIHYAAVEGHTEIVSFLLDRGADINSCTEVLFVPSLLLATAQTVFIKCLLMSFPFFISDIV
jgi:ankyrin repeat protein